MTIKKDVKIRLLAVLALLLYAINLFTIDLRIVTSICTWLIGACFVLDGVRWGAITVERRDSP